MAPFATASIGRPRKPIAYCNTALSAAIMAAVRKVLFHAMCPLIFAALLAASSCLFAQTPAWPPSPDHVTMPLWPNGAPWSPTRIRARRRYDESHRQPARRQSRSSVSAMSPIPRSRSTLLREQQHRCCRGCISRRRLPHPGHRPRRHRSLRLAELDRHQLHSRQIPCPAAWALPKVFRSASRMRSGPSASYVPMPHEWHIDPNRIGVLGFSAGAHLAAALSTHFDQRLYDPIDAADKLSCRPDFAVIVYPGYLALADQNYAPNPDIHPTTQTPPTFIVQAEDDPVHVENAVVYFIALKNAKVPAELHIYAEGGHGYGLRRTALPVTTWPQTRGDMAAHHSHITRLSEWRNDQARKSSAADVGSGHLRSAKYASSAGCSIGVPAAGHRGCALRTVCLSCPAGWWSLFIRPARLFSIGECPRG